MESTKLPSWAVEMLERERVGRLAFLDDRDLPRVLPVTFAFLGDALWSAIDQKPKRSPEPARVRYLRRTPEAALVVDAYDEDWSRLRWVQVRGRVEIVETGAALEVLGALAAKYEQYERNPPPGPLLRLGVDGVAYWRADDVSS